MKKLYTMTDSLFSKIEPYIVLEEKRKLLENKKEAIELVLFKFNPNTISKDSLILLGFESKAAETMIKFRTMNSGFNNKEELK